MADGRARISAEVLKHLKELDLESLGPKLDALGVRGLGDLSLVDDADLVRWGLTTIERRRFFGHIRKVLGEGDSDGIGLLPPSALTSAPATKKATARMNLRPESGRGQAGPARLDELLGRGSAEHQVPRLAERLLAATGPLDLPELSNRLSRAAPALAQGYSATEWPQFVEAAIRSYKRLQVEDGVLAGDSAVVSICNSVLFSASEEVVADTTCWAKVCLCLSTPGQVSIMASLCRASREVADGPAVWGKLLKRWYPKATLLNPDWLAQAELEKKLEEALENDYALAALTRRNEVDTPLNFQELINALPQQTTPKALMKFMSKHPDNFRQSPDGTKFCVLRNPEDLKKCKDWRTVNPFTLPPMSSSSTGGEGDASGGGKEEGPKPIPMGMPTDLRKQAIKERQQALQDKKEEKKEEKPSEVSVQPGQQICQQLDPKQAFRLYHTGLLSQKSDQSKRGKLEAWEYYTESNAKCVMAPGDLLDICESRTKSIRSNDPAVVHELVSQTIEGMVYKIPFGFWNRRVRILSNSLNASQLRIGREQRKKLERKLLEFMEWVKKERGFGYYQCEVCGSRWKSGFSYEEIQQQCLQCGGFAKPYRIQDLESKEDRERREKGEEPLNKDRGGVDTRMQPAIKFQMPQLEHGEKGSGKSGKRGATLMVPVQGAKRYRGAPAGEVPQLVPPPSWKGAGKGSMVPAESPKPVVMVPPRPKGPWGARPKPATSVPPTNSTVAGFSTEGATKSTTPSPTDGSAAASSKEEAARYKPGEGGFFAQKKLGGGASAAAGKDQEAGASQPAEDNQAKPAEKPAETPAASSDGDTTPAASANYKPGAGGFFARRKAAAAQASSSTGDAAEVAGSGTSVAPASSSSNSAPASSSTPATSRRTPAASAAAAPAAEPVAPPPQPALQEAAPAETYKAGGGGFFARRRATTAGNTDATAQASNAEAAAPAGQAAAGAAASSGGFFARRRASITASDASAPSAPAESAVASSSQPSEPPGKKEVEKSPSTEALPAASADLSALGLTPEEAAAMGIMTSPAEASNVKTNGVEKKVVEEKDKEVAEKKVAEEKEKETATASTTAPQKREHEEEKPAATTTPTTSPAAQLAELRKAKAARFAAAKAGKAAQDAPAAAGAKESKEEVLSVSGPLASTIVSDEALVDAVSAAVTFANQATGESKVLSGQAADAAYLVSDAVFWTLLRRLAAEVAALEQSAPDLDGFWAAAPSSAEGALAYAQERGFLLPDGVENPTAHASWRRALLSEAASDLMTVRVRTGRGFDLPALAGPAAETGGASGWVEKPSENLAGLAQAVEGSASAGLAEELVQALAKAAALSAVSTSPDVEVLKGALASVADSAAAKEGFAKVDASASATAPALQCAGFSLLQEMGIREQATAIRNEYSVRRHILLRRLDLSVQAMCTNDKSRTESSQRRVADTLSRMWSGWRPSAAEAPPLSEWSALAAPRGVLASALTARVSGPGARVSSAIKSIKIGTVPNRGGKPEGYSKSITGGGGSKSSGSGAARAKERPAAEPKAAGAAGGRPRAGRSFITEGGTAASSSNAVSDSAAAAASEGPAAVGEKKSEKKGTADGARSVNKDMEHAYKKQKKEEYDQGGPKRDYYKNLADQR